MRQKVKSTLLFLFGGTKRSTFFCSIFFGFLLSWILRNDLTSVFLGGKSFSGRGILFKILFLALCWVFFSNLLLILFNRLTRNDWFLKKLESFDEFLARLVQPKWQSGILFVFLLFVFVIGTVWLLYSLDPQTNDDAFIYYNYARNFVEGRPFAYDSRNIPSEGFTSLLYLLLLIPFEYFKVNLTFASTLINLVAIFGILITVYKLLEITKSLSKAGTCVLMAAMIAFITLDENIKTGLEWGLETMLGSLMVFLAAYTMAYAMTSEKYQRGIRAFFIVLFMAYVTRPESLVFLAAIGVPILLINKSTRKGAFRSLIFFSAFFILYHIAKYFVFEDFLPTGFYRKVSAGSGFNYVWGWVLTYKFWLLALFLTLLGTSIVLKFKKRPSLRISPWLWFLLLVSVQTLLFFTQTRPIIGIGYRFLITPIFVLCFSTSLLVIRFFDLSMKFDNLKSLFVLILLLTMVSAGLIGFSSIDLDELPQGINILAKSWAATAEHKYLQFGNYLTNAIPDAEDVTLVFGDAGAIPYSFHGRFVDSNGLTEPAIAHLFQIPDGPQKAHVYSDYILSQHPDIVVLARTGEMKADGIWYETPNEHSPFRGIMPASVNEAYLDYGIIYSCSLRLYMELHIGLNSNSPHYDDLQKAILPYCQKNGFILADGLSASDGMTTIHFPRDPKY